MGARSDGYVDRPYTVADVRHALAVVTGDRGFADTLVDRYIEGHDVMDYERLLANAGLVLRASKGAPGVSNGRELEIVTTEAAGGKLTDLQRAFRARWLN